jgi:hypothetical protein
VLSTVVLLSTVLYFYSKSSAPKYRWTENYDYDNVQPYGLKLVVDILSVSDSKSKFVFINEPPQHFINDKDTGALYMFIGEKYICDSSFSHHLTDFVKRGNNAFISSIGGEHWLFSILTNERHAFLNTNYLNDSIIHVKFDNPKTSYKFDHKHGKKLENYKWVGLDSLFLKDSLAMFGFEPVSFINNELVDCMRIKYGKGWFIFHSSPLFFTNYSLSKKEGLDYINHLIAAYKKPRVLWDEFSKSPLDNASFKSNHESPLRFILSERSLRWSWYLLCFFVLLFVIFNSKRKQAPIPLMPANNNTTIEYIDSIAMLYYKGNSTSFLTEEIMKQFLSFVKHKYKISTSLNKEEIPGILAPLSGIPENDLIQLFKYYKESLYSFEDSSRNVIELHRLIEKFYQNCK